MALRTFSATSAGIELECVFFSVTPNPGRRSMIALALTSNSRASSLIRTLFASLIRLVCSRTSVTPAFSLLLRPPRLRFRRASLPMRDFLQEPLPSVNLRLASLLAPPLLPPPAQLPIRLLMPLRSQFLSGLLQRLPHSPGLHFLRSRLRSHPLHLPPLLLLQQRPRCSLRLQRIPQPRLRRSHRSGSRPGRSCPPFFRRCPESPSTVPASFPPASLPN